MRVVIAEDLALLRDGIAALLADGGHEVVAAVGDGKALLDALGAHRPDLAIVDVRMPPTQTDEGVRAAVERPPPSPRPRGPELPRSLT
jgi:DNA-binding NarL/FixJ family response regulator